MEDWTGRETLFDSAESVDAEAYCVSSSPVVRVPTVDAQPMAATRGDEVQAFSRLVERHLPSIYRLCYRMTGDRAEAEDLTQESFVRLWLSAREWRSVGGGVPAWLHRVARNLCVDRLRSPQRLTTDQLPEIADGTPDAVRQIQLGQLLERIEICLQRLSPNHRSALLLCYYEGHSNALAARMMEMNLKAFESLLLRARRSMSAQLDDAGIRGEDLAVLS
jgi:RNA polymerase sigma-70 factor (ECF subfamily)